MICPMKQFFSYLGASLAAIAALASCNKEIDAPVEDLKGGVPFEICASTADTKTAIDGEFKTTWVVGATPDSINVYHKLASAAEYTHDGKFLAKTEEGKFLGTLAAAPEAGEEYQWLAKYPYDKYLTTPAEGYSYIGSRSDKTQSQKGLNSTAHLSGYYMPLVGKGTSTGTASPTITMEHASSVLEINVTNNTSEALDVTSIAFTAPESIIGQFVIDYTGQTTTYTARNYVSATATLSVSEGTIAAGKSGKFYLAIKPFTATAEQTLSLSVNGYSKDIPHDGAVTFTAGKIKKVNFNFDKVVVDYVTLPWSIDGKDGSKVFSSTPGLSASGLGSDYASSNSPYLTKFDTNNDYVLIKTDSQIGAVTIGVKMIGGASNSYFDVQGSADGNTFATVEKLTISGAQNSTLNLTTTKSFDEKYRYVKLLFTKGSNVGVGPISISKVDNTPAIVVNDITNVPAAGVSDATASYTIKNAKDDVIISEFSGCVSAASASAGTVTYSVSPNYSSALTTGTIVLVSSSTPSLTKTISVSQLKSTLEVSEYEVIIPATSTESNFTVTTPEFGYNTTITVKDGMSLTISSGSSGTNKTTAQTITVSSTTAAPTEGSAIILGTIKVYRNGNPDDIQAKTVTIKKDVVSDRYYQKVSTITSGKSYLIVGGGTTSPAKIMQHPTTTAATVGYVEATVSDDQKIAASTEIDACVVTITKNGNFYTLSFDTNYIAAGGKNTNLKIVTSAPNTSANNANWTITTNTNTTNGSFRIKNSSQSSRAIMWRSGDTNKFGDYSTSNATGTEYFDIDLYEFVN